jgi:hypothetical protein
VPPGHLAGAHPEAAVLPEASSPEGIYEGLPYPPDDHGVAAHGGPSFDTWGAPDHGHVPLAGAPGGDVASHAGTPVPEAAAGAEPAQVGGHLGAGGHDPGAAHHGAAAHLHHGHAHHPHHAHAAAHHVRHVGHLGHAQYAYPQAQPAYAQPAWGGVAPEAHAGAHAPADAGHHAPHHAHHHHHPAAHLVDAHAAPDGTATILPGAVAGQDSAPGGGIPVIGDLTRGLEAIPGVGELFHAGELIGETAVGAIGDVGHAFGGMVDNVGRTLTTGMGGGVLKAVNPTSW